jgi:hypothetical protein
MKELRDPTVTSQDLGKYSRREAIQSDTPCYHDTSTSYSKLAQVGMNEWLVIWWTSARKPKGKFAFSLEWAVTTHNY